MVRAVRAFCAGFIVVAVLSVAVVLGKRGLPGRHVGAPASAHATARATPAATADASHDSEDVIKPGTGAGFDRELASVIDALESGDAESAFRDHTSRGIYGMQSAAGDRGVAALVRAVRRHIKSGRLRSIEAVSAELNAGAAALARAGHDDVYDTVVLDHIYSALNPALRSAGMDPDELDIG
jgi:hypothetical protein